MKLEIRNMRVFYGNRTIIRNASISLSPGITAIVGPNGAGKSTLMKACAGIIRSSGSFYFDGKTVDPSSHYYRTNLLTYLPQDYASRASITVFEAVLLGRVASLGARIRDSDIEHVERVLESLGIEDLSERYLSQLSGGQQQLVSIGRALIRRAKILFLDEPTSNLDLRRQFEVCETLRRLVLLDHSVVAIALHDLNIAVRCADSIIIVYEGEIYAAGTAAEVITQAMFRNVYGLDVKIELDRDGRPKIWIHGVSRTCS